VAVERAVTGQQCLARCIQLCQLGPDERAHLRACVRACVRSVMSHLAQWPVPLMFEGAVATLE
jgi:hypothetical protein